MADAETTFDSCISASPKEVRLNASHFLFLAEGNTPATTTQADSALGNARVSPWTYEF